MLANPFDDIMTYARSSLVFFFNDTATTEIYTLSLHDALPISAAVAVPLFGVVAAFGTVERGPEPIPTRIVVDPLALSATPTGDPGTIIYFQEDRFKIGRAHV